MPLIDRYRPHLAFVVFALVVFALLASGRASRVSASVIDVAVETDTIAVGETTSIEVETSAAGSDVVATIEPGSTGGAVFVDDGTADAEAEQTSVAFGYGDSGVATFVVQGTAAGTVTLRFTDEDGEAATTSITVVEAVADDDLTTELEGEVVASGSSIVVFTGGSVQDLIDTAGALDVNVVSIFLTVDGEFVGIIIGAPDFVNAEFFAEFENGIEEQGVIITAR